MAQRTLLHCTLSGSHRLRGYGDSGATSSQRLSLLKAGAVVPAEAFAKDWQRSC